jgi:hypothetical protein
MTRRPLVALAGTVAALALVAACGSDNSSSSSTSAVIVATTTTSVATSTTSSSSAGASTTVLSSSAGTASPQLCTARDNLRTSIQDLTSADVLKNGTSGLQDAVNKVKDNLQAVKTNASADLQPQVKAFEDSLTALGNAISNVSSGGVGSVVTAASTAAQDGQTLLTALNSLKC